MSLDSLQISRGAIWLYMHHTSFERTQLRDKRKRLLNLWFLPQDEYMWVNGLSRLYRMLPKGIISFNQSRILKHGLHNWRAGICLEDLKSVKISTIPIGSISLLRSINKDWIGGWYLKYNQHCNTSKTWDKIRGIWYKKEQNFPVTNLIELLFSH